MAPNQGCSRVVCVAIVLLSLAALLLQVLNDDPRSVRRGIPLSVSIGALAFCGLFAFLCVFFTRSRARFVLNLLALVGPFSLAWYTFQTHLWKNAPVLVSSYYILALLLTAGVLLNIVLLIRCHTPPSNRKPSKPPPKEKKKKPAPSQTVIELKTIQQRVAEEPQSAKVSTIQREDVEFRLLNPHRPRENAGHQSAHPPADGRKKIKAARKQKERKSALLNEFRGIKHREATTVKPVEGRPPPYEHAVLVLPPVDASRKRISDASSRLTPTAPSQTNTSSSRASSPLECGQTGSPPHERIYPRLSKMNEQHTSDVHTEVQTEVEVVDELSENPEVVAFRAAIAEHTKQPAEEERVFVGRAGDPNAELAALNGGRDLSAVHFTKRPLSAPYGSWIDRKAAATPARYENLETTAE
ncbi:hypothetical protein M3Y99_00837000 [Aphelenchoides fujianensis]|nr:hypothetical protein M3Y99_00837000 [Aphelenchoides fujianensis]